MSRNTVLWIALFFFSACNSAPKNFRSDRGAAQEPGNSLEILALLGTNDLHGNLAPLNLKTQETHGFPVAYQAGGTATIASYVKTLRSEFGEHLIWLDAGDAFQGTLESNLNEGATLVHIFNQLHLNAAALGNHDFDFGLQAFKTRVNEAHYPYLAANLNYISNDKIDSPPKTKPHVLITAGKLKVGIIGLSSVDHPPYSASDQLGHLKFENLKMTTLREADLLREKGAHIVVLLAHVGLKCDLGQVSSRRILRKPTDPQGECGDQDELVRLLQSLPLGTLDAVVSGHSHQIVHHWVAGIPVIQAGALGRYLNVIYLTYDWAQKKILTDQSRIEGPIPVCTQVFQHQNDCNGDRPTPQIGRGPLVPIKFHDVNISPDSSIQSLIDPILLAAQALKSKKIGIVARTIKHTRLSESALGNLVTDAIRHFTHTDVAYINEGGLYGSLKKGPLIYDDLFKVIPFETRVVTLQVTGRELETFLQVAESGSRGFGSVSGIHLKLMDLSFEAPFVDLNGDGKEDLWKIKRLTQLTLAKNEPLNAEKLYSLATVDFLAAGGDDLSWPLAQIPNERRKYFPGPLVRDVVARYVSENGPLNSEENPLVDLRHPRLLFEKPKKIDSSRHPIHQRKKRPRKRKF